MRTGNNLPSRPAYYDRSAVDRYGWTTATAAAPAAVTVKFTYTVPANRKFILEAVQSMIERVTAAAPAGLISAQLSITGSAGGITQIGCMFYSGNLVGAPMNTILGSQMLIPAAGSFSYQSGDASTGGTASFLGATKGTEFDA